MVGTRNGRIGPSLSMIPKQVLHISDLDCAGAFVYHSVGFALAKKGMAMWYENILLVPRAVELNEALIVP